MKGTIKVGLKINTIKKVIVDCPYCGSDKKENFIDSKEQSESEINKMKLKNIHETIFSVRCADCKMKLK